MYARFGVPPEIEKGLVGLLRFMACPKQAPTDTLTVVTRDPSLWSGAYSDMPITLLDLSTLIPFVQPASGFGVINSQMERRVRDRLLLAGWNADQIKRDYRATEGRHTIVPDFALLDRDGQLVAVVEVKGYRSPLGEPIEVAVRLAKLFGARYGLVTNGEGITLYDSRGDDSIGLHEFPGPEDLCREAPQYDYAKGYAKSQLSIVPVLGYSDLADTIGQVAGAAVLDHTLPLNFNVPDELTRYLPQTLNSADRLDLATILMAMVADQPSSPVIVGFTSQTVCLSPEYKPYRDFFLKHHNLGVVMELPSDLFRPFANIKSVILRLAPPKAGTRSEAFMSSVPTRGALVDLDAQVWYADLKRGLRGQSTEQGLYVDVRKGDKWTPTAYRIAQLEERIAAYGRIVRLDEIFDVFQGLRHSLKEVSKHGFPVVRGRDISAGINSLDQLARYDAIYSGASHAKIVKGDVLIQRIGRTPSCRVASPALEGSYASNAVYIIRPRSPDADPFLLCEFLSSQTGQALLGASVSGSYVPTLSLTALRELPIPILPETVANDLREISDAELNLRAKSEELRSLQLGLFSASSKTNFEKQLQDFRQVAKAISAAVQQAKGMDFQVRNFYPFPLAFAYRASMGVTEVSEAYKEHLRVAENVLAFLASVSLALLASGSKSPWDFDIQAYWRGGISPGDWREICQRAGKHLGSFSDNRLARALASLWTDKRMKTFRGTVDELIRLKNDFKHDRGPKIGEEIEKANIHIKNLIQECLKYVAFFIEHPLRLVCDLTGVRGSRSVSVLTLMCIGDHPGFTQERLTYPEPLTKDDLYIEIGPQYWLPLHPFIIPRYCPSCRIREIYFVDKWGDSGKPADLKSFERGHTRVDEEVAQALALYRPSQSEGGNPESPKGANV